MSDMLTPLQWVPPEVEASRRSVPAKARHEPFCWPAPPFANYPDAVEQSRPEPCEILGLNESRKTGRLIFFVPEESVVHVQVPPARTTVALRFQQFKALTLLTPLAPVTAVGKDAAASMLGQPEPSSFCVMLRGGGEISGVTIGHFEMQQGCFFFSRSTSAAPCFACSFRTMPTPHARSARASASRWASRRPRRPSRSGRRRGSAPALAQGRRHRAHAEGRHARAIDRSA